MSTPHVAGAFSLLRNYRPDLSAQQIKAKLYEGSEIVSHPSRSIENNKRLNIFNTLKLLDNKPPTFTEINIDTSEYCLHDTITYSITGKDDIELAAQAYSFDNKNSRQTS